MLGHVLTTSPLAGTDNCHSHNAATPRALDVAESNLRRDGPQCGQLEAIVEDRLARAVAKFDGPAGAKAPAVRYHL